MLRESAAGRSGASGSVGGGLGYKDSRVMGRVDRMQSGRARKRKSPRKQPFIGRIGTPFEVAENGDFIAHVVKMAKKHGVKGEGPGGKLTPAQVRKLAKMKDESLVSLEGLLDALAERARKTSGFGVDFTIPMGIHGIGTSPNASGDLRDPAQKYKVRVEPGSAKVQDGGPFEQDDPFAHLPRGGKKKRRRRKR